jgi:hypothetical protein
MHPYSCHYDKESITDGGCSHNTIELLHGLRREIKELFSMADLKQIGDLLVLIGALVGLIQGILMIIGAPFGFVNVLAGFLDPLIIGILAILFSLIALVNSGFLKISALDFGKTNKFIVVLIIGILMILFTSDLGGILVILGAILWLL